MILLNAKRPLGRLTVMVALAAGMFGVASLPAHALAPIKENLAGRYGWETDKQTKSNSCTVKTQCQPGKESEAPGGFAYPHSVAADNDAGDPAHHDHIYVADTNNNRVQELTASGEFVSMFGWDVNRTKEQEGAPQTQRNICAAVSHDTCQKGAPGTKPGQINEDYGVAVDSHTGNVFVEDLFNYRVQEFTAGGEFVLMIGKHVNATTGADMCTATEIAEGAVCQAGERGSEKSSFAFVQGPGNLLAVGGPENLLYVGEEHRVQEFTAQGEWKGEIPLGGISSEPLSEVAALAVSESGDVYLVYSIRYEHGIIVELDETVRELGPAGEELGTLTVNARQANAVLYVHGLALDPQGRLAILAFEGGSQHDEPFHVPVGLLYDFATGKVISEFTAGAGQALTFNDRGELFEPAEPGNVTSAVNGHEVLAYKPVAIAELVTGHQACVAGAAHESDAVFDCALEGEANPYGVGETEAWFDWGRTCAFGAQTPAMAVLTGEALAPVTPGDLRLKPNEGVCYRLVGFDQNVKSPEAPLSGEAVQFTTPTARPVVVGQASATFVKAFTAVLSGRVNPENSTVQYAFEYGPCEDLSCAANTRKVALGGYGPVGATLEVRNLQPATRYWYRPVAVNEETHQTAVGEGGGPVAVASFTTAPAPAPSVLTQPATGVGSSSATLSGSVDPDGRAGIYTFELGIDRGGATQYSPTVSAPTGSGEGVVGEQYTVSGLQPGTTYSYRIVLKGAEETIVGASVSFTTAGLPAVLTPATPLPLLATPPVSFPTKAPAGGPHRVASKHKKRKKHSTHRGKSKPSRKRRAARRSRR